MPPLTLGLFATSRKADELRLPVHPDHLADLPLNVRERIVLEHGYGARFGVSDTELSPLVHGMLPRQDLLEGVDVVVLPKPLPYDVAALPPGRTLWGWPHCVQDEEITQIAIDRRLTVIAWEAMHHRTRDGAFSMHVFHKNNELAGYCSVLHALALVGRTGAFGPRLRAAVISFGATGRGAVAALFALGVHDVDVLTHRNVSRVAGPITPARLVHYGREQEQGSRPFLTGRSGRTSMSAGVASYDIVVNCVLQDTDDPLMFVVGEEIEAFAPGSLIVDVSCDEGMAFDFARPTSFADPMFTVGPGVRYYAVDHSPSYLWDSATWEVSEALIPFLGTVSTGEATWDADPTIGPAIEIRGGVVQNPRILSFQNRAAEYPHAKL